MPQMAPLYWLTLFTFFSMTFLLFNSMNYFLFTYNIKKPSTKTSKLPLKWKW
uniref:ATP synthase complex subunit 8 n=1 Tax=Paulhutchinsonia pilosicollis TaxID=2607198 RepID=A0A6H0N1H2_9CUCU|nr:ATP synthase F0 subunit 8 [Paulhutchinsonia pilosicollis]QIV24526.1 ATP synthase F0 subunit 8 [Paulhutchinsonia pilosicollis]